MARTRLELPAHFPFSVAIPVRITDINYGGHVGNDAVLSLVHEARMQFLLKAGLDELGTAFPGMIMREVTIEFRKEIFYGDILVVFVVATNMETASFDLVYKMERGKEIVTVAKTGMVCYDYIKKKISALPPGMISCLSFNETPSNTID